MVFKTITSKVTIATLDEAKSIRPTKEDPHIPTRTVLIHHKPGTPVRLEADEADAIIARHGGEVVAEPGAEPAAEAVAADDAEGEAKRPYNRSRKP